MDRLVMTRRACALAHAALAAALVALAGAAPAQTFDPDEVAVFDGAARLDYPPSESFALAAPATIELWVAAGWTESPGYDPCVLAAIDEGGVAYAIHLGADRRSLVLYAGDRIARADFDFSDGAMHHVMVRALGESSSEVAVDGEEPVLLAIGVKKRPNLGFHVGSLDGEQAPFIGAIARVRLWNALLDADTEETELAAQSFFSEDGLRMKTYPQAPLDEGDAAETAVVAPAEPPPAPEAAPPAATAGPRLRRAAAPMPSETETRPEPASDQ